MNQPLYSEQMKRLIFVGNICAQWSNLEYQVAQCIWWMLKLDTETGKIVTGGLDMLPRLNMAINLARHSKAPARLTDALIRTRAAVQDKLDIRRNRAVHGVQFLGHNHELLVEVHRGKGGRERKPLATAELNSIGSEIHSLALSLAVDSAHVIAENKSQLEAMLRKIRETPSDANSLDGS